MSPYNIGNHWLEPGGLVQVYDDARAKLPAPLEPGHTVDVDFATRVPKMPGLYRLQLDVVQEGVAWFATCGSLAYEVLVRVGEPPERPGPAAPSGTPPPADVEPVMEMHAVPRHEVEALLHQKGARLLDVRPVHHCGPAWVAFRYDVTH